MLVFFSSDIDDEVSLDNFIEISDYISYIREQTQNKKIKKPKLFLLSHR